MKANATRSMRVVRAVVIGSLAFVATEAVAFLVAGHFTDVIVLGSMTLILAAAVCLQSVRIHRREHEINRPRPDYASIARMEREVYGETFEHEGAPVFTLMTGRGGVSMSEMGGREERATGRMRPCIGCGSREVRVGGKCPACYQRAKRQVVTVTYTTTGDAHASRGGGAGGNSSAPNFYPGGSGGLGGINPYGPIAAHLRGLPVGWPEDDELGETDHA